MTTDARRIVWSVLLLAYVGAVIAVVLAPTTAAPDRVLSAVIALAVDMGAPPQPTDHVAEVLLNVVLTAPLAILTSLIWPVPTWRDWTAGAFLLFSAVELTQGLLLPARDGSFSDIVANTGGCCLGAIAVRLMRNVRPTV